MPRKVKQAGLIILLGWMLLGLGIRAEDITSGSSAGNETTSSSNELAGFSQAVLKEEITKASDNLDSSNTQLQFTGHNTLHVKVDSNGTETFSEAGQTKTIKHFITWDEGDLFGYFCMGYLKITFDPNIVEADHVTSGAFSTGISRRGTGWIIVDPWMWFSEDDVPPSDPNRLAFTITWKALQAGTTTFAYTVTNSSGGYRGYFLTGTVHNMQAVPAVVDFAPQIQPPAAPSNLVATAVSSSQINLTWQDNSDNEQGFIIESKTSCHDPFVQIAVVESNPEVPATTYSHTNLSPGAVYYYRIRAYNVAGNSAPSNMSAAVTFAHIPTIDETITTLNNVKAGIIKPGLYESFSDRLNEAKSYLIINDYKSALDPLNSISKKLEKLTDNEMTVEARLSFGYSLNLLIDYLTLLINPTAAINLYLYGYPCQNEIRLQQSGEQVITTSLTGDLSIELKPTGNPGVFALTITRTAYTGTAFTLNNINYGTMNFANNPAQISSGTINLVTGQVELTEKLWIRSPYIDSTIGEPVSFSRVSKGTFYPIGLENGVIQVISDGTMPAAFNDSPYQSTSRMHAKKPKTRVVIQQFEYVEVDNPREISVTLEMATGETAKEQITESITLRIPVSGKSGGRATVTPNIISLTIPKGENKSEPITVIIKGTATSDQNDDVVLTTVGYGWTEERFTVIDMQIKFANTFDPNDDLIGVDTEQTCYIYIQGPVPSVMMGLTEPPKIIPQEDASLTTQPPYTFIRGGLTLQLKGVRPSIDVNKTAISAKVRVRGYTEDITCVLEEDFTVLELDLDIDGILDTDEISIGGIVVRNFDNNNAPRKKIEIKRVTPTTWNGNVNLILTRNNDKVKIFTAPVGGTEIKFNGRNNKFSNAALPKDFWVEGFSESTTMRDATISLEAADTGGINDKINFTVLWVSDITGKTSGKLSPVTENAARDKIANDYFEDLGVWRKGWDRYGLGIELKGTVKPSDFNFPVVLQRDGAFRYFKDTNNGSIPWPGLIRNFSIVIPPGNDTSPRVYQDNNPLSDKSQGEIYDYDAPGIGFLNEPIGTIIRARSNMKEYAVYNDNGAEIRCSLVYQWYCVRSGKKIGPANDDWIQENSIRKDNKVEFGSYTNLTWDLK
ncbi:MAG: fibronectin type III domain-containing protein [Planctomycetes bacterium]|nr:fibronectin type III domain-containing protein [Planctomycetota bacterium]